MDISVAAATLDDIRVWRDMYRLFQDQYVTSHAPADAVFRQPTASEAHDVPEEQRQWRGLVDVDGKVAATGGILFHYNRPFGDIHMDVEEGFRRRGLGSFLVQELKRMCYEGGHVPGVRRRTTNLASQRTLQKAGFVPCGHILVDAYNRRDVFLWIRSNSRGRPSSSRGRRGGLGTTRLDRCSLLTARSS
jgi:GNAT superfamily N-acetyltransferase